MASINLRELRRRLPHGSLARIAVVVGISPEAVGQVLNKGWYPQYRAQVCDAALSILDESKIGSDIMEHAKEHELVSAHSIFVPAKKKKRSPVIELPDEEEEDELTWDDLCEMETEELEELCDELDIHLSWFERNLNFSDEYDDELRERIADELGIEIDEDDDEDEDEDE